MKSRIFFNSDDMLLEIEASVFFVAIIISSFIEMNSRTALEKKAIESNEKSYIILIEERDAAAKRLNDSISVWKQKVK
jgi:hypothetical protein